jgi:hypothetical protein
MNAPWAEGEGDAELVLEVRCPNRIARDYAADTEARTVAVSL